MERGDDVADTEFLFREEQGQYANTGLICERFEYIDGIFHAAKYICLNGYSQVRILESTYVGCESFREKVAVQGSGTAVSELT